MNELLSKIKKLNWVLSESTTGNLSFSDLSGFLSEINDSNLYILDNSGKVLGVSYRMEDDTSTFSDESGLEKVPEEHNRNFLKVNETRANVFGEELKEILGNDYELTGKYHTLIPCICGGVRLGTILLTRYEQPFNEEEIALCELGATVVALEMQRNAAAGRAKERSLKLACEMAFETLSFSERDALEKILDSVGEDECIIVASKIASKYKLTNSVIVSALKKLESAGLLETKSLGMKGTYIRIINPYLRDTVENAKI